MVMSGSVASSTDAMPDGTYFSAQNSGPYSATNMSNPMRARLRHWDAGWPWAPPKSHETVKHNTRHEKSCSRGKERWYFQYRDPNGKKRSSPQNVNREERQQDANIERLRWLRRAGGPITVVTAIDGYHLYSRQDNLSR